MYLWYESKAVIHGLCIPVDSFDLRCESVTYIYVCVCVCVCVHVCVCARVHVCVCVMGVSGIINKSADQVFSFSGIIKVRDVVSKFILKIVDLLVTIMSNNQL